MPNSLRRFIRASITLFTVAIGSLAHAQTAQQLVDDALQAAIIGNEAKARDIRAQIDLMTKPAQGDRQNARALNTRALALLSNGALNSAVDTLYEAASADIADPEIASNLGYALLKAGRPDSAQKAVVSAINLQSWRAQAWLTLGEALAVTGDIPRATAAFEIAFTVSQDPQQLKAYLSQYVTANITPALAQAAATAIAAEGIKPQHIPPRGAPRDHNVTADNVTLGDNALPGGATAPTDAPYVTFTLLLTVTLLALILWRPITLRLQRSARGNSADRPSM